MRLLLSALAITFLTMTAQPAKAAVEEYTFDTAHTQILFFVNHLGFSMSQGEFHEYEGGYTFDRENPANSSIDVTIKTASIDMDHEKWNAHMKNEDFFDVEKFPDMTFKSTNIEVTGENTGKITGDLTILDVTKPVTLDVTFNKGDVHPFSGKYVTGFSGKTTINRSDFGMTYGIPGVGENVIVRLEVEGERVEPPKTEG